MTPKAKEFKDISDELWAIAEPLLEPFKPTRPGGAAGTPYRVLLGGMLYQIKTGCQWDMIPNQFGKKSTIHEHFQRWVAGGFFDQLFISCADEFDELQGINWEWQAQDGTLLQAPTRGKKKSKRM